VINRLYLAANQIELTPWWGHLQIVAEQPGGGLIETEVQAHWNWVVNNSGERPHNASTTPNYGDPGQYEKVEIDLTYSLPDGSFIERTATDVWELILQTSEALATTTLGYGLDSNSNSYVNTLFKAVGLNLSDYMADIPAEIGEFPGSEYDAAEPMFNDIDFQIRGTAGRDVFFGGGAEDYIGGGEGDDFFGDGKGEDVIEGGEGNDEVRLAEDGYDDIVIVGEGDDKISGGDSGDRLVIRVDQFLPDGGAGLGELAKSYAIPLLGGFMFDSPFEGSPKSYHYANYLEQMYIEPPDEWYRNWGNPDSSWQLTHTETIWQPDYWSQMALTAIDPDGEQYRYLPFDFIYELSGSELTIFIGKLSVPDGGYYPESTMVGSVTISDFENGDFGIYLYENSYLNEYVNGYLPGPPWNGGGEDGPQYYVGDGEGVRSLNNDGQYLEVPNLDEMQPGPRRDPTDPITGTAGDDNIQGTPGDDQIYTGDGDDNVNAGDGDDTIIGGSGEGNDIYNAGDGNDTLVYSSAIASIVVNLQLGIASGANIGSDTFSGVENVVGGSGADTLVGNSHGNRIVGGAGADTIVGGGGADTLLGGEGGDTYAYSSGDGGVLINDQSVSTADVDTLQLLDLNASDIVASRSGRDLTLLVRATGAVLVVKNHFESPSTALGIEQIAFSDSSIWQSSDIEAATRIQTGTEGSDKLLGTGGNDTLNANGGNDVLDGAGGVDTLTGGLGDDTYIVDTATDTIVEHEAEGLDLIRSSIDYTLGINAENLTLLRHATSGTGNGASNTITGNEEDNILAGLGGADLLIGGGGADVAVYTTSTNGVNVNLETGVGTGGDAEGDTFNSVEDLSGSAFDDILRGSYSGNVLYGMAGADILEGGYGGDTLDGGVGADTLIGGEGNDTFFVDDGGDVIQEFEGEGTDTIRSSISFTLAGNLENLVLLGSASLYATGNAEANILTGNSGDNVLHGEDGDDTMAGGVGIDTLFGGTGNDTFVIDDAGDIIMENEDEGTDTVATTTTFVLAANLENLTLVGLAAINGTGNAGANELTGNEADNILAGGAGNDIFVGGGGTDTMIGGLGDDIYFVEAGDVVTEATGEGTDTIQVSVSYVLAENFENLNLVGAEAIDGTGNAGSNILTGNNLDNVLSGGSGADSIYGRSGADTLAGGLGDDNLTGGNHGDTYLYATGHGSDVIDDDTASATDVDILKFTDWNASDLTLSRNGSHLNVKINSTGENITIRYQFYSSYSNWGIEQFSFADGSLWDLATINANAWIRGTSSNNTIIGFATDDTILGDAGNDTVTGGDGNDTYIYRRGDGNDIFNDASGNNTTSGAADRVVLKNVQPFQVTVQHSGNDLRLLIAESALGAGDGGQITLAGTATNSGQFGIESVEFENGTVWTKAEMQVGTPPNRVPVLANALADQETTEGANVDIVIPANAFSDPDGQPLSLAAKLASGAELPSWLSFDPVTRILSGEPPSGSEGAIEITITAFDGALSVADTFVLDVAPGQGGGGEWAGANDTVTTTEETPVDLALIANDTIPSGANVNHYIWTQPEHGTVYWNSATQSFFYEPDAGFTGTDTLVYGLHDGDNGDLAMTPGIDVTIVVEAGEPGSGTWIGGDDSFSTREDSPLVLNLLANDVIPAGANYNYYVWAQPDHGTVYWSGTHNSFVYEPDQGFTGTDSFVYGLHDADNGDVTTTPEGIDVTIDVTEGGDTFVFGLNFGQQVITDFTAGTGTVDVIEFDDDVFADFASVLAAASQAGADTLITADVNNTVTLNNVTQANLHQDDFRFVA
jgi:Ca2+-binding RTX toxin-like protein